MKTVFAGVFNYHLLRSPAFKLGAVPHNYVVQVETTQTPAPGGTTAFYGGFVADGSLVAQW